MGSAEKNSIMNPEVTARVKKEESSELIASPLFHSRLHCANSSHTSGGKFLPPASHGFYSILLNSLQQGGVWKTKKLTLVIFDFPLSMSVFFQEIFSANIKSKRFNKNIFPFTQTQKPAAEEEEKKSCSWDKWNFLFGFKAFFFLLSFRAKIFFEWSRIIHRSYFWSSRGLRRDGKLNQVGSFPPSLASSTSVWMDLFLPDDEHCCYWFLSITFGRLNF